MSVDPTRVYEIQGQVYPLQCASILLSTGMGQTLVAATAGFVIGVMGYKLQSNDPTVVSQVFFRSNSTLIFSPNGLPTTTTGHDDLPIKDIVYFKTALGQALNVDVTVAAAAINVFYITYKP